MTIGTDHGMPNIEQFLLFIRTLDWRKSEGENAFANVARTGKNASFSIKLILKWGLKQTPISDKPELRMSFKRAPKTLTNLLMSETDYFKCLMDLFLCNHTSIFFQKPRIFFMKLRCAHVPEKTRIYNQQDKPFLSFRFHQFSLVHFLTNWDHWAKQWKWCILGVLMCVNSHLACATFFYSSILHLVLRKTLSLKNVRREENWFSR